MAGNRKPMGGIIEVFKKIYAYFKERGFKQGIKEITKEKFHVYWQWVKIKILGARIPEEKLVSYSEQLVYRMLQCPDCVAAGKCKSKCACDIPEKMLIEDAECELKFWGQMKEPKEWNEQKQEDGINFLRTGK
jgi:hypothetical protein